MLKRAKSDQLIADLLEWEAGMGGFDSPVWDRARRYMDRVRDKEDREFSKGEST